MQPVAESRGKFRERQNAVRLQAVDGRWPHEYPPVSSTGRVGQLGPQGIKDIDLDILTANYGGESKSSGQKAKNPGHRITLEAVATMYKGAARRHVRPLYAISLPRHTLHGIDEWWHYRFMIAWEMLQDVFADEQFGVDFESMEAFIDAEVSRRLADIPDRYRKVSDDRRV